MKTKSWAGSPYIENRRSKAVCIKFTWPLGNLKTNSHTSVDNVHPKKDLMEELMSLKANQQSEDGTGTL